ncbi:MAG: response regulator [Patescibacteria group bacterium]|nr:response regulator [Patescibacteria group bacterium]
MDTNPQAAKVVIVEDNASLADIYKIRLELLGYRCFAAYDGQEALAIIERELPDLVLLDLMVPKVAGDQILATMRASEWGKDIKVLIISNLNEADAPAGLRERGIEGYAIKANLSNDQLDQLVDKILKPTDQEEDVDLEAPAVQVTHTAGTELPKAAAPVYKDLIITRTINAPVSQVWKAWTTEDQLVQWWGPENFSCPYAKLNIYTGGLSVIGMQAAGSQGGKSSYSSLAYTTVVAEQRLEFIHNLSDQSGNKIDPASVGLPADFPQGQKHEIIFKAVSLTRTELTVIEREWPVSQMLVMSQLGMEQCLYKLESFLTSPHSS